MSRGTRLGIALVGSALGLGALGDMLFQGQQFGLNVGVWTLAFVGVLTALLRVGRAPLHQGRRYMLVPLLVFAALFAWHSSPLLVAANLLALAAAVTMGALRSTRTRLRHATLSDYGGGFVGAATSTAFGAAPLLMSDIRWREVVGRARSERVTAVARGMALGLPLLVLFGALFVAADAVFKQLVSAAVPSLDAGVVGRVLIIGLWAWLAGGLLRDLIAQRADSEGSPFAQARRGLGALEIGVALAILDVLFLAFVVVQFRYLFGGGALVARETGPHLRGVRATRLLRAGRRDGVDVAGLVARRLGPCRA